MADRYEYSDKAKTPKFRGMFVNLFRADKNERYGLVAIFEDGYPKEIQKSMLDAAKAMWSDKAVAKLKSPKCRSPLSRGEDQISRDGEPYLGFKEGDYTVKFSTKQKPGVADRRTRAIVAPNGETIVERGRGGEDDVTEVNEENEIYSGAYYRCTFQAMAYDREDGFGVALKLENIQKMADGERVGGGRAKLTDDFESLDAEDEDLSDDEGVFA